MEFSLADLARRIPVAQSTMSLADLVPKPDETTLADLGQIVPPPRNMARAPAAVENFAIANTVEPLWDVAKGVGALASGAGMVPEVGSGMMAAVGLMSPGARLTKPAAQGIRAYHGSPHDFDRFDLSKIGTGEGAQAYGHGLYFAENPKVAQDYRRSLTPGSDSPHQWLADAIREAGEAGAPQWLDAKHRELYGQGFGGKLEAQSIRDALAMLRSGEKPNPQGKMYEVNINAEPQQFLDWDKPLAQQPSVAEIAKNIPNPIVKAWTENGAFPHVSGSSLYDTIGMRGQNSGMAAGNAGGRAYATDALREAGIPGIKYLDQGSRFNPASLPDNPIANEARQFLTSAGGDASAALKAFRESGPSVRWATTERDEIQKVIQAGGEKPTSNYVVFNDKLIDILRKYGIAVPGAGAAASQMPDEN